MPVSKSRYLPVGELSDFRFYWKSGWRVGRPSFIGEENPDWPGAYKAKYWMNAFWSKVLQPHLDRILDAGFDGVWLDGIDAYWYWYEQGYDPVQSANRMAKLVRRVAEYARAVRGDDFIVVANNGLAMLDDASSTWRANYLADIDGVNVESLFYNYWDAEDQEYRLDMLALYAEAGKLITNVEYIDDDEHEAYFATLADQEIAIRGYAAAPDGELDELNPQ
jgi:cysteinyl-tRNA synthetase